MSGATKLMTAGGGGVSLTPASSIASDVTVNVPSQNCTLGIQGPAFSAYQSAAQTLASGTFTKLTINTEEFDTASCYDNATNYRFTPNVAGYYQVSATYNTGNAGVTLAVIYRNGSAYKYGVNSTGANMLGSHVSCLVYLNGSTDYVEFYGYTNYPGGAGVSTTSYETWFQAAMVRAA